MSFTTAALLVTWSAILLVALALAGISRQLSTVIAIQHGVLRPRTGPVPGMLAPMLEDARMPESETLLAFLDAECDACTGIFHELARFGRTSDMNVSVLFPGAAGAFASGSLPVLENQAPAFEAFGIPATPFAVLIDDDRRIVNAAPVGSIRLLRDFLSPNGSLQPGET